MRGKPYLEELFKGLGLFGVNALRNFATNPRHFFAGIGQAEFGKRSHFIPAPFSPAPSSELVDDKPDLTAGGVNYQPEATFALDGV